MAKFKLTASLQKYSHPKDSIVFEIPDEELAAYDILDHSGNGAIKRDNVINEYVQDILFDLIDYYYEEVEETDE